MAKKILSLAMALVLVLGMCTFASAETEIKWSGTISSAPYMTGPIEEDQVTALVEEALKAYGYDVKFDVIYLETAQYRELLNLRLTSGDAPDRFKIDGDVQLDEYWNQGLIRGWSEEFFREHAPDTAAFIDAGHPMGSNLNIVAATWAMSKRDGEMVSIPLISRNQGSLTNILYNTKWLENLGAEVPETLDEFIDLMYRFTNEDPDGNGQNDTYGMSSTMISPIFGAYGCWPGFMNNDAGYWHDIDGVLVSSDVHPNNKEALGVVRKLYEDGVLDPEFITGENQGGYWAISHSLVNGRVGVSNQARMTHYTPADLYGTGNNAGAVLPEFQAIQGADAGVTVGPWPEGPYGDAGGFLRYTNTNMGGMVYNADVDDEKLAAIFEILNIFSTDFKLAELAQSGIEGVHWEYKGDEFNSRTSLLPDDVAGISLGISALRGIYGPETPLNAELHEFNGQGASAKWIAEFQASYKNAAATTGYPNALWAALPSQSALDGELKTFRNETWTKIITGELELDYYDTYVEEWKAMGGDILTQEANDWYAING